MRSLISNKANGGDQGARALAPLGELAWTPDRLFDRLMGDFWGNEYSATQAAGGAPLELVELDDSIKVVIEVPGIDPEALDISLTGQILTISGEKQVADEAESERRTYSERRFGSLRRAIKLPVAVNADSVTAEHKHGVVTITLKKSDAVLSKRIEVKAG